VAFAVAIGLKWIHITFEMMCMAPLGQTVLPAFYAVIGKDTIWFLCFMGVILLGTFQFYWSLPIPDNLPAQGMSHFEKIFLKIFRMDVLGEVDMWDLEGVNYVSEGTIHGNSSEFQGTIHEGKESHLYHDAIVLMIIFFSSAVAILVMNVLVGIVGQAYDYNKTNSNHIWSHYRAPYVTKLLVRRKFWKGIASFCAKSYIDGWLGVVDQTDFTKPEGGNPEENMKGIFIGCHQAYFLDMNDTTENLRDIISQQEAVREEMDLMDNLMKDKVVVSKHDFALFEKLKAEKAEAGKSKHNALPSSATDESGKSNDQGGKSSNRMGNLVDRALGKSRTEPLAPERQRTM
jgi:hypothetical protein